MYEWRAGILSLQLRESISRAYGTVAWDRAVFGYLSCVRA